MELHTREEDRVLEVQCSILAQYTPSVLTGDSMLAKCSLFYSYLQFMEILRKFSQKTSKIWPLIRLVSKQLLLIILWSYLKSNYLKTRTLLVRERERENVFASYRAYKGSTISRAFQSFQNKMLVAGERLMNEFRIWTLQIQVCAGIQSLETSVWMQIQFAIHPMNAAHRKPPHPGGER